MALEQDPRWSRLDQAMTALKPGQTITVNVLVIQTGLGTETVELVLNGLTNAELFVRKERNVFVRRSLLEMFLPARAGLKRPSLREAAVI